MNVSNGADLKTLEADFVKIVRRFGENRGIGYGAWRDAGRSCRSPQARGDCSYARLNLRPGRS